MWWRSLLEAEGHKQNGSSSGVAKMKRKQMIVFVQNRIYAAAEKSRRNNEMLDENRNLQVFLSMAGIGSR